MNELFDAPVWEALSRMLVRTLGHFLWQGLLVGGLTLVAAELARHRSAALRYGIFLSGLVALAACPVATLVILQQADPAGPWGRPANSPVAVVSASQWSPPEEERIADAAENDPSAPASAQPLTASTPLATTEVAAEGSMLPLWEQYSLQIAGIYGLGVLFMLARALVGVQLAHSIRREAEPIRSSILLQLVRDYAQKLGLSRVPPLAVSARITTPCVIGAIRPMILFPAAVLAGLPVDQLEVILAHELAHLRRKDHWVWVFQRAVETILFFHPMVWWMSRRLSAEREVCCDDAVVAQGGSRSAYAESLVRVAELSLRGRNALPALAAVLRGSDLRRRVTRILEHPTDSEFISPRSLWSILPIAALILAPLIVFIAREQALAQTQLAHTVFQDDFQEGIREQWSIRRITTSPSRTRTFLGPFESGVVKLSLKQLPAHELIRVSFDLLILGSWDGDTTQDSAGPDAFALQTGDGRLLHLASFAAGAEVTRHLSLQSYPGLYGVHSTAARSGAAENDAMGFRYAGMPADSVYRIETVFPHTADTLELRFIGSTSSLTADEIWGLDNVQIVAEDVRPSTSAALATAWEQLRSENLSIAMQAVSTLAMAGDRATQLIRDRIQGHTIPPVVMTRASEAIPVPIARDAHGVRFLPDPSQRRLALAAHTLQVIGSETARAVLSAAAPGAAPIDRPQLNLLLTDADSRLPLSGVPVRVTAPGSGTTLAITDEAGKATIRPTEAMSPSNYSLQFAAEQYIPVQASWPRGQNLPDPLEIPLQRGVPIGGKVIDDAGQPVEDAIVLIQLASEARQDGRFVRQINPNLSARTDREGRWTYPNAPRDRASVQLGLYHPHHATRPSGEFDMQPFDDIPSLYARRATLTLQRGTPIQGIVVDPAGHPVPHATLSWGQSRFGSNLLPDQTTDERGLFQLAGYSGDRVYLTVKAPGFAPEVKTFDIGPTPIQTRFELLAARTLTGKVSTPDGLPISGAMLYLDQWRGTNALDMRLFTDSTGRFIWDSAPGDSIQATVSRTGYRPRSNVVVNSGAENEIVLDPILPTTAPAR